MAAHRNHVPATRVLCIGLGWLVTCLVSSTTQAAGVYEAIHIDELGLSEEQQDRRNKISRALNVKNNLAYIIGTVAGFVPEPVTSYSGEISAIFADITLKHTKASLYAPDDLVKRPNSSDECRFEFVLPQSAASYDNILGAWPTLKVVDSILPDPRNANLALDQTVDFGALGSLGRDNIRHANAELRVSLLIPGDENFVEFSDEAQTISLLPGTHNVEWRAETLWFPVWDTVVPSVTTALMIGSETKWLKKVKALRKLKAGKAKSKVIDYKNKIIKKLRRKPDTNNGRASKFLGKIKRKLKDPATDALADVKSRFIDSKFKKKMDALNQRFNLYSKMKKRLKEFDDEHPNAPYIRQKIKYYGKKGLKQINDERTDNNRDKKEGRLAFLANASDSDFLEGLKEAIFLSIPTVSRSRNQTLTIYNIVPPTITTSDDNPTFEATDIGGARKSRYFDDMLAYITAADACGGEITIMNNAPELLPLGETPITWTVRSLGSVDPKAVEDHDGDGVLDNDPYYSRSVTQIITIADTQAPLMIPPPGLVIESEVEIDLNTQPLGQPLVVDLADLFPDVAKTASSPGCNATPDTCLVTPDTRTVVTWTATDNATPPNQATDTQLVTVKTPGTNTAPVASAQTAETLTSQPVDIMLTGVDNDLLPFTGGVPAGLVPDPLRFKIEQRPLQGEFVAPLYPYFIDDYRTDKNNTIIDYINNQPNAEQLMQDYIAAVAAGGLGSFVIGEFCDGTEGVAPVDYVLDPLFVHVTDDGEQYFLDHYRVCDPDGGSGYIRRISRWDKEGNFLGHFHWDAGSSGTDKPSFVLDPDGNIYYFIQFGVNEIFVQICPSNITETTKGTCPGGDGYTLDNSTGTYTVSRTQYIRVDSSSTGIGSAPLIYAADEGSVAVFRGQSFRGILLNDAGQSTILGLQGNNCIGGGMLENGMELDSAGNLYIADTCGDRIHKVTASTFDSSNTLTLGNYVGWMGRCNDNLTIDNLACDVDMQRSRGFSCTDSTCDVASDTSGSDPGQFNHPLYLAMDPNDVLYVADFGNQRIQRFASDGTFAGQAKSVGNGINAESEGSFVLGNMGPPKHVSVNSEQFFVVDAGEKFIHIFEASPFKDITDSSATVTYVSPFDFHSDTDTFTYSVNDGLVDSNVANVSVDVARNYRQPLPEAQVVTTDEDRSVAIVLSGSDPDGIVDRGTTGLGLDSLAFVIREQPKFGKLVRGGDAGIFALDSGMDVWTYTPNRDYHGSDSFSFTVRDAFTDATIDGATPIPEPYGEADPINVDIAVASVNDIPVVRIDPPERVAAGFPILLLATAYDDIGNDYAATLDWGDGQVDWDGDIEIDDKDTADVSDDEAMMTGVILSFDGLYSTGESPVSAMHSYTEIGSRSIELCLRDDGPLETCDSVDIVVEHLVVLGAELVLSDDKLTDGVPFDARVKIINGQPIAGVTGLDAGDVTLQMEIPEDLILMGYTPSQGDCTIDQSTLSCSLGALSNAAMASVDLVLRGKGTMIYDRDILLDAEVSTSSAALESVISSSASVLLEAITLDRDNDGLPNIFEAFYGVNDPAADDDGDGLDNITELEQGTSPIESDSDGDGLSDGDEIGIYDTDPTENDTDGDGLADNDELLVYGTNPLSSDSDEDGLPDQWELDNGYDPLLADSDGDVDSDGLSDLEEFQLNTDHQVADTDGDTLLDGDEVNIYGTNPLLVDTDDDGLNDNAELTAGTDQLKPDSDDDGLLDGDEINVYGSLPLVTDTDLDGLPDGWEVRNGRDLLRGDYQLAAGGLSSCALTDAGVECWGRNDFGQAPPLVGGLVDPVEVTVGFLHACALDIEVSGPTVKCWGRNDFGQISVPALIEPLQVAAGSYHNCVLDRIAVDDIVVKCWGRDLAGVVTTAPALLENPVRLVSSISGNSSCVLDDTAAGAQLICWGQDNNINAAVPGELISSTGALALGSGHGCVVDNGSLLCWGLNDDGQAPPGPSPSSSVQLSLGGFHSCSLDQNQPNRYSVACWGLDINGQATVPSSLVAPLQLASGSHHSCAFDQGNAKCWGVENSFDQGQAPVARTLFIDPDGDSVRTADEIANGTNPLDADSDRDQLTDDLEIEFGTDPLNADSDEDGLSDWAEINVYFTDPLRNDTDADGMPDGWEVDNGLSPTIDDASSDNDADGLSNGVEFDNGTEPGNADSDSDGLDDGAELALFRFDDSGQALGTAISEAVELGDLDGDGDLDAFVANRADGSSIWDNDGEGNFTLNTENSLNALGAVDVALGDIDLDGDLDAVLAHPDDTETNTLWINGNDEDPPGLFTDSGLDFGPGVSDGVELRIEAPEGALPKLFVANWGATQTYLFDGQSLVFSTVTDTFAGNSEDIAIGDLNGDNWDDAFVVNRDQPNQVFAATDPLQSTMMEISQAAFVTSDTSIAVALGDLDGDDDLDAYEVIFGAGDRIWLNDGFGNFTDSGQLIGSDDGSDVSLIDIDRDGDLDAIVANIGVNRLWLNDGNGVMSDSGVSIGSGNSFGLSPGDVDNDGVTDLFIANDGPNRVLLLKQLDPNSPDSDADNMFDGWEVDNGFDPLDNADAVLDPDFDGLNNAGEFDAGTDPRNSDTDMDGMPDGWEVSNGLDPLVDDSALDLDIDGLSNLEEYQQGSVPEADDVPPLVTAPGEVSADSTGLLTEVSIGSATAFDFKDGVVPATADDEGPYITGNNDVTWSAADFSGNVGVDNQTIGVIPLVNFSIDQVVAEGTAAMVGIQLNGLAVNYPVQVDYSITGTAINPDDHDAVDGSVLINSGSTGAIAINIVQDTIFEADETIVLTIDSAVNALAGSQISHTLTIAEKNIIPTANIVVTQQGKTVTTVAADGGPITVTAVISDPNPGDSHSIDWSASDSGVFDITDFTDLSYSVDPIGLGEGLYRIVVNITDDGSPIEMNNIERLVRIVATLPLFNANADSDGDGVSDLDEGMADGDSDGVPDYLDANNAANVLLMADDGYMLETQTGLSIRLGKSAFAQGFFSRLEEASIEEDFDFYFPDGVVDFEIHGVEPGGTAMVVLPLRQTIQAGASYRKYMNGTWQDFVEDGGNMILSAAGGSGACPSPGDPGYLPGLIQGDSCIQLLLQDGGANDADGLANGVIIDPSGLALPADVMLEILSVSDQTTSANSADNVVLALRITTDAGGIELESLTLQAAGSGDDRDISSVNLIVDANQNKSVDVGEVSIGSGTFNLDNGSLTLQMSVPYLLPPGPTDMLVTLDF